MKCIVLAAGYATRLYPLTENFPKPLLDINGKSIIDWLLGDVDCNIDVNEYIIITNHRFAKNFEEWKQKTVLSHQITVLDDGSTENGNRLGAVRDIVFGIERLSIQDDLLVLAGDNVLDFSLKGFVDYFKEKHHTCVMRHYEASVAKLQKTGVATVDDDGRVLHMEEKPSVPNSNWAVPPFYIYARKDLPLLSFGISSGCDTDAPGSFISWLCNQCDVYAYEMPGKRYDIGDLKSYEEVKAEYKGVKQKFKGERLIW